MFGLRIEFVVELLWEHEMSVGANVYLLRCGHIRNSLRRHPVDSLSNHRRLPTEGCTDQFRCKCTHQQSMLFAYMYNSNNDSI